MAGQRSNQLNYVPTRQINKMRNNQCLCGIARLIWTRWFSSRKKIHPVSASVSAVLRYTVEALLPRGNDMTRAALIPIDQPRHKI